ncbi:MAG: hypothetical protein V8Q28_04945 [Alistipes sp.]
MNKLICHVGLLCGVLLGMLDATFAQFFAVQRVGCGKQAVILIFRDLPVRATYGGRPSTPCERNHPSCPTMPGFAGVVAEQPIPLLTVGLGRSSILSG